MRTHLPPVAPFGFLQKRLRSRIAWTDGTCVSQQSGGQVTACVPANPHFGNVARPGLWRCCAPLTWQEHTVVLERIRMSYFFAAFLVYDGQTKPRLALSLVQQGFRIPCCRSLPYINRTSLPFLPSPIIATSSSEIHHPFKVLRRSILDDGKHQSHHEDFDSAFFPRRKRSRSQCRPPRASQTGAVNHLYLHD